MEEEWVSERVKKRKGKRGEGTGYLYPRFALCQSRKKRGSKYEGDGPGNGTPLFC